VRLEEKIAVIREREPQILGHESMFKSAVLLPIVEDKGEKCVLFEKRAHSLGHQPGEICFPGGKVEPGEEPRAAAVRETCEELGIKSQEIELLMPLDILVSPFGAIVYPFVGQLDGVGELCPNPDEVDRLFWVPINFFMENRPLKHTMAVRLIPGDDYPFDLVPGGTSYPFREGVYPQLFYRYEGEVIWGMTARILDHFINLLR